MTRLRPDEEADLRWYFAEASGAVGGLRSASLEPGHSTGVDTWRAIEAAHDRIAPVERWRRIHARLVRLTRMQRRTLEAYAMGRVAWPWDALGVVGRVAGLTRTGARLRGSQRRPVVGILATVRAEADALLGDAVQAYQATAQGGRACVDGSSRKQSIG